MFITLAIVFGLIAFFSRDRFEWVVLCGLNASVFTVHLLYGHNDDMLYLLRSVITLVAALLLCIPRTLQGYYQACILLMVLCSYAMLAFDVSQGKHVLIYDNFETVIYGLVTCQFIGFFKGLWDSYRDTFTSGYSNRKHSKRSV